MTRPIIVWFRNDLRLADHRALAAAAATGAPVLPLYVLDEATPGDWKRGAASLWWLHHSLAQLGEGLADLGAPLVLARGDTTTVIPALAVEIEAEGVYCSRQYEPWAAKLETALHARLEKEGVALKRYPGTLLHEPDRIETKSGGPFKVYTPFGKALRAAVEPPKPVAPPKTLTSVGKRVASDRLDDWGLLPTKPDWAGGMREAWTPGEAGAHERLETFLKSAVADYASDRNRPDRAGTSRLSPHLHFGEITPAQCWRAAAARAAKSPRLDKGVEVFVNELLWREFSYHLLFHEPDLPETPLRPEFARFPWAKSYRAELRAWQRGRTGYPIVDAGMRELWTAGWMHNRVRMLVASFLIKDLMIPWQEGERWFWDTLVDADLANNAASWQWVAGSGADAAPYFRVFNPVLQGLKFDPDGDYVRRWVPELAKLEKSAIHAPWEADADTLAAAAIVLGKTYPKPILDHHEARTRALAAFSALKPANAPATSTSDKRSKSAAKPAKSRG